MWFRTFIDFSADYSDDYAEPHTSCNHFVQFRMYFTLLEWLCFGPLNRESGETGWSKAGKVEQEVSSELMLESLACIEAKSNLAVKRVASRGLQGLDSQPVR